MLVALGSGYFFVRRFSFSTFLQALFAPRFFRLASISSRVFLGPVFSSVPFFVHRFLRSRTFFVWLVHAFSSTFSSVHFFRLVLTRVDAFFPSLFVHLFFRSRFFVKVFFFRLLFIYGYFFYPKYIYSC